MENIELDLSTESEDEFQIPVRQDLKIPDEFSVDNLLIERAKNPIIPHSYSIKENVINNDENFQNKEKKSTEFIPPIEINHFSAKDGCIFTTFKNQFPFSIFKILEINENEEESIFLQYQSSIPKYFIKCIQYYPFQLPPSLEIFFSYAHYLISNNILDSQMSLFKYSQLLPQHVVDYKLWRAFLIYSIKHSLNAIFSLFSVCNFYLFQFATQEQEDNARIEIFLLFSAMLCTSEIIEHKFFPQVLHQMRSCLTDVDFDLSQINFTIKVMTDIFLHIPVEMVASVVSFFPIDGIGALLLNGFSIRMIFHYFGLDFNNDDQKLNIEFLANELYRIQVLCESDDNEDLKKASAVLALSERALVSSISIAGVPQNLIIKMIHSLRFSLKKTDLGLLTLLKEQIHFTRTQFESMSQNEAALKSTNLFFSSS